LLILLVFLSLLVGEGRGVVLEGLGDILDNTEFRVNADGSVLMHSGLEIIHWSRRGRVIHRFAVSDPDPILHIHDSFYDEEHERYLISTQKNLQIFDRENGYLGRGYDSDSAEGDDVLYRSLYRAGDDTYAYLLMLDFWVNPNPDFLVRFDYARDESGDFAVRHLSETFASFSEEQHQLKQVFRRHWLLEDEDELFLIYELAPYLRRFTLDGDKPIEGKRIPLALIDYVRPPKAWNTSVSSRQEITAWFSSWSRITGFYDLETDWLIGYHIPDPETEGEKLLGLQKIDRNGRKQGPVTRRRGLLIGTHEGLAYIVRLETQTLELVPL